MSEHRNPREGAGTPGGAFARSQGRGNDSPISEKEKAIRQRLQATSRRYFKSGLSKAGVGDLSRAREDLVRAVRYDKHNEMARNLLGMVSFQMGELGEAMKQWSISEYLNPKTNWATYYLREIQKEEKLLQNMSESILLYNEGLSLAEKGDLDYAALRLEKAAELNPYYIKAQLLLSLIYMEKQENRRAMQVLDQVAKIDPLNPEAMRYRLYLAQAQTESDSADIDSIRRVTKDLSVQQALPEPELYSARYSTRLESGMNVGQRHFVFTQVLMFAAGILLGLGLLYFLWVPDRLSNMQSEVDDLNLRMVQTETINDELETDIQDAKAMLEEVDEAGQEISNVLLARIKQLLESWRGRYDLPEEGE